MSHDDTRADDPAPVARWSAEALAHLPFPHLLLTAMVDEPTGLDWMIVDLNQAARLACSIPDGVHTPVRVPDLLSYAPSLPLMDWLAAATTADLSESEHLELPPTATNPLQHVHITGLGGALSLGWIPVAVGGAPVEYGIPFQLLAENASDVVIRTAVDRTVAWVSPTVTAVLGWHPGDLVGVPMTDLMRPGQIAETERDRNDIYAGRHLNPAQTFLLEFRTRSGSYRWMSGKGRAVYTADGVPDGAVAGFRDVSDLIAAQHELTSAYRTDELTGAMNRAAGLTRVDELLAEHASTTGAHLALLFVDVDDFKTINDTAGHDTGDTVLRVVAQRLGASLRDTDLLVRLGGDEFLIALPGVSSLDSAAHVADKLRAVLRESISTPDTVWNVSASIGVVVAEVDQPLADAITRADRAMYAAKAGGRDRTVTA